MSNSKNRKNLIDLVGVNSPLSVLSCRQISERNAVRARRAACHAFYASEIENLIKLSKLDESGKAISFETPKVEKVAEAVKVEKAAEIVKAEVAEPSEPKASDIAASEWYAKQDVKASDISSASWMTEASSEVSKVEKAGEAVKVEAAEPSEPKASDIAASEWYAKQNIKASDFSAAAWISQATLESEAASKAKRRAVPKFTGPRASDIEPSSWYEQAQIEHDMRPSDYEASHWYRLAEIRGKKSRGFKTLAEESAVMPEWERKRLSKITFDQKLVDDDVILSVRHLKKFFTLGSGIEKDKLKAVHDVSFDVKKGEVFGLVGESGCGKTTTGRTIMRLHEPTSGSVYFMGYRIGAGARWNQKEIKWKKKRGTERIAKLISDRKAEIKEAGSDSAKAAKIAEAYDRSIASTRAEIKRTISEQKDKIRRIRYDEKHVDKHLLTKMQMIFQDPIDSLDPRMTVQDIIQEGLKIQNYATRETERLNLQRDEDLHRLMASDLPESIKKDKAAFLKDYFDRQIAKAHDYKGMVSDVLRKVGLIPDYANRYPHEFSGGQRQRIGIARALIMKPELIIADEPISALDVSIRAQIINLLNDLRDEMGLTIVFIAHDLSVVKYFCERIAVMYYGNLVELASSDELFKHPLHPYTKSLLSAIPKPDPLSEKTRVRIKYNPAEDHDYSRQEPRLQEIVPGHFVLANDAEMDKYRKEIVEDDEVLNGIED